MPIPLITFFEKGPRGSGTIQEAGDAWLINADSGQVYRVLKSETSPYVEKVVTGQKVAWALNTEQTGLWSISPWSGVHVAKYEGMILSGDMVIPEPTFKEGGPRKTKGGGSYVAKDRFVFTVKWKLLSPPYDGIGVVKQYTYAFYLDNGTVIIRGGKDAARLWNMMEAHGMNMDRESIPAEDNVLPWMDGRLRELDQPVQLKFEEGWVNDVNPMPVYGGAPGIPTTTTAAQIDVQAEATRLAEEKVKEILRQMGYDSEEKVKAADQASRERVEEAKKIAPVVDLSWPVLVDPPPPNDPPTAEELKEASKQAPLPGFTLDFTK